MTNYEKVLARIERSNHIRYSDYDGSFKIKDDIRDEDDLSISERKGIYFNKNYLKFTKEELNLLFDKAFDKYQELNEKDLERL